MAAQKKMKESESVKIPTLPTKGSQFRAWKLTARQEVIAASGVPRNEIIHWVMDIEKKTFGELADPGPHESLCTKIGASVSKLAHGELGRKITLEIEKAAKQDPPLVFAGRQSLRMVYDYYVTDRACGAVDDYDDLLCVVWLGDAKIESFIDNWDHVISGMESEPPEEVKLLHVYRQVKKCNCIKFDLDIYERLEDKDKTYDFLRTACLRHINKERQKATRASIQNALKGNGGNPAAAATNADGTPLTNKQKKTAAAKAKRQAYAEASEHPAAAAPDRKGKKGDGKGKDGKGRSNSRPRSELECFRERDNEVCDRPNCEYKHKKPVAAAAPTRGRSSSPRPRTPSPKGRPMCHFFKKGKCRNGDKCTFSHEASETPSKSPGGTPKTKASPKR